MGQLAYRAMWNISQTAMEMKPPRPVNRENRAPESPITTDRFVFVVVYDYADRDMYGQEGRVDVYPRSVFESTAKNSSYSAPAADKQEAHRLRHEACVAIRVGSNGEYSVRLGGEKVWQKDVPIAPGNHEDLMNALISRSQELTALRQCQLSEAITKERKAIREKLAKRRIMFGLSESGEPDAAPPSEESAKPE